MIDYEILLERCKREETKELMIQCLDKASKQHHQDVIDDFISALEIIGIFVLIIILGVLALKRIFE